MAAEEIRRIQTGAELSVGDEIEAWHNGKLFHRGRVSQTVASMDLVWILDSRTGARRLIDVGALVILRATGETAVSGTLGTSPRTSSRPAKVRAKAPARPASHGPLFQAPSLAN